MLKIPQNDVLVSKGLSKLIGFIVEERRRNDEIIEFSEQRRLRWGRCLNENRRKSLRISKSNKNEIKG